MNLFFFFSLLIYQIAKQLKISSRQRTKNANFLNLTMPLPVIKFTHQVKSIMIMNKLDFTVNKLILPMLWMVWNHNHIQFEHLYVCEELKTAVRSQNWYSIRSSGI